MKKPVAWLAVISVFFACAFCSPGKPDFTGTWVQVGGPPMPGTTPDPDLEARLKVKQLFHDVWENADDPTYKLAQDVLKGRYAFLEEGAITTIPDHTLASGATPPVERKVSGERAATRLGASG